MKQSFVPDGEYSTTKLLSSTSEIGISLLSNLESYLLVDKDNHDSFPRNDSLVQEHCKVLSESIRGTITSLVASEKLAIQNKEVENTICSCDYKVAAWSQSSRYHLSIMFLFFLLMFGFAINL